MASDYNLFETDSVHCSMFLFVGTTYTQKMCKSTCVIIYVCAYAQDKCSA